MEFGRTPGLAGPLDVFPLPPFHLEVQRTRVLPGLGRLRYGLPIWGCKQWIGGLYPAGTSSRRMLEVYSRRLAAVEVNSTFYGLPNLDSVGAWVKAVPDEFRFYPKVPQSVSHHHRLGEMGDIEEDTERFVEACRVLGSRLGSAFLQLPPQFTLREFPWLRRFVETSFPETVPLCVELRHESWFPRGGLIKSVYDLFSERGIGVVITETPGKRALVHASVPSSQVLIRFLGSDGATQDARRIREWLPHWKRWVEMGREITLFLHLPENERLPELLAWVEPELKEIFGEYACVSSESAVPEEKGQMSLGLDSSA